FMTAPSCRAAAGIVAAISASQTDSALDIPCLRTPSPTLRRGGYQGRSPWLVGCVKPLNSTTATPAAQASQHRPLDRPTKNSACLSQRARSCSGRSPVSFVFVVEEEPDGISGVIALGPRSVRSQIGCCQYRDRPCERATAALPPATSLGSRH